MYIADNSSISPNRVIFTLYLIMEVVTVYEAFFDLH
jgi:hypothetical protein